MPTVSPLLSLSLRVQHQSTLRLSTASVCYAVRRARHLASNQRVHHLPSEALIAARWCRFHVSCWQHQWHLQHPNHRHKHFSPVGSTKQTVINKFPALLPPQDPKAEQDARAAETLPRCVSWRARERFCCLRWAQGAWKTFVQDASTAGDSGSDVLPRKQSDSKVAVAFVGFQRCERVRRSPPEPTWTQAKSLRHDKSFPCNHHFQLANTWSGSNVYACTHFKRNSACHIFQPRCYRRGKQKLECYGNRWMFFLSSKTVSRKPTSTRWFLLTPYLLPCVSGHPVTPSRAGSAPAVSGPLAHIQQVQDVTICETLPDTGTREQLLEVFHGQACQIKTTQCETASQEGESLLNTVIKSFNEPVKTVNVWTQRCIPASPWRTHRNSRHGKASSPAGDVSRCPHEGLTSCSVVFCLVQTGATVIEICPQTLIIVLQ